MRRCESYLKRIDWSIEAIWLFIITRISNWYLIIHMSENSTMVWSNPTNSLIEYYCCRMYTSRNVPCIVTWQDWIEIVVDGIYVFTCWLLLYQLEYTHTHRWIVIWSLTISMHITMIAFDWKFRRFYIEDVNYRTWTWK
jgi:hypothetical protein